MKKEEPSEREEGRADQDRITPYVALRLEMIWPIESTVRRARSKKKSGQEEGTPAADADIPSSSEMMEVDESCLRQAPPVVQFRQQQSSVLGDHAITVRSPITRRKSSRLSATLVNKNGYRYHFTASGELTT